MEMTDAEKYILISCTTFSNGNLSGAESEAFYYSDAVNIHKYLPEHPEDLYFHGILFPDGSYVIVENQDKEYHYIATMFADVKASNPKFKFKKLSFD